MNLKRIGVLLLGAVSLWPGWQAALAQKPGSTYSENYETITDDGAWCWFSDPRAIYVGNQVIGGYVDKEGSIWAFSYDVDTREKKYFKLYNKLDYDDHANPSFMKLPDNRIVSFFSAHGGTTHSPIFYRITKRPADISEWDELQQVSPKIKGQMGYCYTNAAQLADEGGKTYLFFRGCNFKPCFISTTDFKNWSEPSTLVLDDPGSYVRPYMKVTNNGKDKIFFAFTDDHPRNTPYNSIYFAYYRDGKYYKADGTVIEKQDGEALTPSRCDKVYDAHPTVEKAWIWDVAFDKDENPVIVYARFSRVSPAHSYWYARWDGKQWVNRKITNAGYWFQRQNYTKERMEYECDYSGGVYLDHENPDIVYTSRPRGDIFEIERWQTVDGGAHWTTEAVTSGSDRDNVRPFVIRGHQPGQPSLLWMYNYKYPTFRSYHSAIRIDQRQASFTADFRKSAVEKVARAVADWQIEAFAGNPNARDSRGWIAGALYIGMFDWAQLSNDTKYTTWLKRLFGRQSWQVGNRMYHADDICVAQTYLDMYAKYKEPYMIIPSQARMDWVLEHPSKGSLNLNYGNASTLERWSWCDALFMAPPAYARMYVLTGEKKYMKFADAEYKATYEHLYDRDEHLFFRDANYFKKREKNGQKIFWGRGNGWVMGGLAEILKTLPVTDKKFRPFYVQLYREMAARLLSLQSADGFWRASLLDVESYPAPETSATGFITYALAYGINAGLLPADEYLPAVRKGWAALVASVRGDGKLGWVQPVGADPRKVTEGMTELYGTGAFLMTACEVYRLSE